MKEKKVKVEFDEAVHGEDLGKLIKDASNQKVIIEGYNGTINELKQKAKEELGVDGKLWNKVFNLYHKRTRERFESENTEVIDLYDSIFPK